MKARYTTRDYRMSIEVDASSAKELFEEIALVQEVFDAESCCGLCGSVDIRFVVREAEGKGKQKGQMFTYYELRCNGVLESGDLCRARFDFGQSLDTKNLFPKRKADEGDPEKGPRGWYRFVPQGQHAEQAPAPASTAPRSPAGIAPERNTGAPVSPDTQALFDRLATSFGAKTAPTRLGSCMDMVRAEFERAAERAGTDRFDAIWREYQHDHMADAHQHGPIKTLLRRLWEDLEVLKQELHA